MPPNCLPVSARFARLRVGVFEILCGFGGGLSIRLRTSSSRFSSLDFAVTNTDHFDSPKHLVSHARDEISDAAERLNAFFERKPYARVIDFDNDTGQEVHKIKLTAQLPAKISVVIKDAAGNLRDALDHAVYGAARAITGDADPRNTGFPFAKNAAGVHSALNSGRLAGNPPEIRPFLGSLQPHEGGNDLLWGLNNVRNPNTHRIIVPVGAAAIGNRINLTGATVSGGMQLGYSRWDPAKNEVEYMRIGRDSNFQYEVQVSFDVLFEGVTALTGKPAIRTLGEIAAEVERVVFGIEAETGRIIAIRS